MAARNLLWQIPLLVLLTYPFWRHPVGNFLRPRTVPVSQVATIESGAVERSGRMEDVIVLHGGPLQRWTIRARQLLSADMEQDIRLEGVRAEINGEQVAAGRGTTTIIGEQGRYRARQKRFTLTGNVEMKTGDGHMLQAEKIHFYDLRNTLEAETDVRFTGQRFEIKGAGLEYDLGNGNIDVFGHVQCRLW